MTRTAIKEIASFISKNDNFALICHVSPDGDTLGSALALYITLTRMGKRTCVICDSPVPHVLRDLPRRGAVRTVSTLDGHYNAIAIDCADYDRMGNASRFFDKADKKICIDHHGTNIGYCDMNLIEPRACATAEIIWALIKELGVTPDLEIGLSAYIGLTTDTGNFTFGNTTSGAFTAASEMVRTGFDLSGVAERVFRERSVARTKIMSLCVQNMKLLSNDRIAVTYITQDDMIQIGAKEEDTEGAAAYLRDIDTVKAAACVREIEKNTYKISIRSKSIFDVAKIASQFGGGGHRNAAGCTIKGTLEKARDYIEKALVTALEGK